MELWFSDQHTPNVRFSLKVDKQLFSETSEFQRVDIFDSAEFGRILVFDGRIMTTERDEFVHVNFQWRVHDFSDRYGFFASQS